MPRPFSLIESQRHGEAVVVGLRDQRLDENQVIALSDEILQAGSQADCRKLVFRFGPKPIECLYSVFLAKLISLQRQLAAHQTGLVLCEVPPFMMDVLRTCRLDTHFLFATTVEQALAQPLPEPLPGLISPPCQRPRCRGPLPGEGTE